MSKVLLVSLAAASLFAALNSRAGSFAEDFVTDPLHNGWRAFGDTNLFRWNPTNQNLEITWDSSRPNSYFYHLLGTVLSRDDDFTLAFDLRLDDLGPGLDTNKATAFQIALGLLNVDQATQTNFIRGTGANSPNLAELAYFWDSGFGATTWPTFVDTNSSFNYNGASDYAVFALAPGDFYHVTMTYTATNQTAITTATNLANTSGIRLSQLLNTNFGDFRLNAVSINSYSDNGQDPQYAGSALGHGAFDNLVLTVPYPPAQIFTGSISNSVWQAQLVGRTNWLFTLERTADFRSWTPVSAPTQGVNGPLGLSDTNAAATPAFYRIRASRP